MVPISKIHIPIYWRVLSLYFFNFIPRCNWTKYYKHINDVIMFSCIWILSQTKFQQLRKTKSNKLKVVLNFEETVTMSTQDLELKKWKQPSVHSILLHCWYEYEIHYIIYFQFQLKFEIGKKLYRVYKKDLNRFEIALNFAKQLLLSSFLYIYSFFGYL
jgi:hypothetical protein